MSTDLEKRRSISKERSLSIADMIAQEEYTNKFAIASSIISFVVGLIITFLAHYFMEDTKIITAIGLGVSALISALPIKEYPSRKGMIKACRRLQAKYIKVIRNSEQISDEEFKEMEDFYKKLADKSAGIK